MPATGWFRRNRVEVLWGVFALANWVAMVYWPDWETVPFHFVWISLTLVYGFRVWSPRLTWVVLSIVALATGASIMSDAFQGLQLWGELFEVPLMSAMFLAMVWHARRRQDAMRVAEEIGDHRARLLERQEAFLHDVSHELRTPVTIARGHLELLRWSRGETNELRVALDELSRIERIVERLLLLAKAEQRDFVRPELVELEPLLSDIFLRWSGIARRAWRLDLEAGPTQVFVDSEAFREAIDALIENAVKHSEDHTPITLRAYTDRSETVIEVVDEGCGVAPDAVDRIFERFARADEARTRALGGVGLGLAIVRAIAQAHGGGCTLATSESGSTFALRLPGAEDGEPALDTPLAVIVPVS